MNGRRIKPKATFAPSDYVRLSPAEIDALEHGERYRLRCDRAETALHDVLLILAAVPRSAREQRVVNRVSRALRLEEAEAERGRDVA